MDETSNQRLFRIGSQPLKMITEGLGDMEVVTECVVDYRDYLWLIKQVEQQALEIKQLEKRLESDTFFDTAFEPTPKKTFKI